MSEPSATGGHAEQERASNARARQHVRQPGRPAPLTRRQQQQQIPMLLLHIILDMEHRYTMPAMASIVIAMMTRALLLLRGMIDQVERHALHLLYFVIYTKCHNVISHASSVQPCHARP